MAHVRYILMFWVYGKIIDFVLVFFVWVVSIMKSTSIAKIEELSFGSDLESIIFFLIFFGELSVTEIISGLFVLDKEFFECFSLGGKSDDQDVNLDQSLLSDHNLSLDLDLDLTPDTDISTPDLSIIAGESQFESIEEKRKNPRKYSQGSLQYKKQLKIKMEQWRKLSKIDELCLDDFKFLGKQFKKKNSLGILYNAEYKGIKVIIFF